MLNQQLQQLRLSGALQALQRQNEQPGHYQELTFDERLSLLLSHELTVREQRKVARLIKQAKFRLQAHPEQVNYQIERGLPKSQFRSLLEGHWLTHFQNLLFTGATGCGKTWLACAIGHHLCQQGIPVRYYRLKTLLVQLLKVHGDGSYSRFLNQLTQTPVLILDDWGMESLNTQQRSDLLDIIDARHGQASTIIASQLPVDCWHELIGEATYADAIMDRLIHRAERLDLKGESMRKREKN
jgi:DNA replication protein DnaC